MKKNALFLVTVILMSAMLLFVVGCSDDDDDPVAPTTTIKPFAVATVSINDFYDKAESNHGAYVSVTNFEVMPGASVNDSELMVNQEISIYGGGMGFSGNFPANDDGTANLVIHFGEGSDTATGSIIVPGINEVVGDSDVVLEPFTGTTIAWTAAPDAEYYAVRLRFDGNYYDNDDEYQYWEHYAVFTTTETSVSIDASDIWPDEADVMSISNMWGDADVVAMSGPFHPGDALNISGSCTGFISAMGYNLDWDFDEEDTPRGSDADRESTQEWVEIIHNQLR